jgi:hypothetical protein
VKTFDFRFITRTNNCGQIIRKHPRSAREDGVWNSFKPLMGSPPGQASDLFGHPIFV